MTITHSTSTSDTDTFAALLADWAEAIVANDADAIGRFAEGVRLRGRERRLPR